MAQTYTIKKGDTLGAVAKKFGTNVGNISGFKSGNANLIFPGETVTIGDSKVTTPVARANEIKSTLAPDTTPATDTTANAPVDFNKFQTNLTENKKKQADAFEQLKGFRTKRYNELRKERGLQDFRSGIDTLDQQIAQKKAERDSALAKVKKNPGASAATITGEVRGVTDQLNAEINNLIEQRNSKANSYNTTLGEIDRIVKQEAGDFGAQLDFYNNAVKNSSTALSDYNKAVVDELRRTQDRNNAVNDSLLNFQRQLQLSRVKSASKGGSSKGNGLTPYQTFQATQSLKKTNQNNIAASQELKRQTNIINDTWNRLANGKAKDLNATSQAIIVTFNKILDPTSVVRESEYDRTGQGQALLSNIQGKIASIQQGGPGLTRASLKELVDLGNVYAQNAQSYIDASNNRARNEAQFFGLNPDFIVSTQVKAPDNVAPSGISYSVENTLPAIQKPITVANSAPSNNGGGGLLNWLKGKIFK